MTSTPFDTVTPADIVPATDAQLRYITALVDDRDWHAPLQPKFAARVAVLNIAISWASSDNSDGSLGERVNRQLAEARRRHAERDGDLSAADESAPLTKSGASKLIDWLREQPNVHTDHTGETRSCTQADTSRRADSDAVPAGRYAVETTSPDAVNALAFYKVDRPTEGRWAGHVFVKLVTGDTEQRLSRSAAAAILRRIADVGAEQASARYGHELGECGVCSRTLTNDESRARGIGPVCAARMGW